MTRIRALIFTILVFTLLFRFVQTTQNRSNYSNGQFIILSTTLLNQPQISGNFQKFTVQTSPLDKVLIITSDYPRFNYGDSVVISGKVEKQVLSNKKITTTIFLPKIESAKNSESSPINIFNNILVFTSKIRQNLILFFQKTLPSQEASLLLGIVFGFKENMPKGFMDNLRFSGVLHVIAASGMNVTMTAGFLMAIFSVIFKRRLAVLISIIGIIFYCFLAGFQPSIIRATIMGSLFLVAQLFGRQNFSAYSLILAGYGMLFFSPELIFDIGFQLSFLSTMGLIYIKPIIDKIRVLKKLSFVSDDLTTSIAAQLATLPILLLNFGSYSIVSLLVNALVLWTVSFLMIFGGIGAILGLIFEPIGKVFLYITLPLLFFFEGVVNFFSQFKLSISFDSFPIAFALAYYCFVLAIVIYLKKNSSRFDINKRDSLSDGHRTQNDNLK